MRKITFSVFILAASMLAFYSCSKEQAQQPNETNNHVNIAEVKRQVRESYETIRHVQGIQEVALETRSAQFIVVPAGSNNALAKAIADAGEGGIVYLRAGLHTETVGITIKQRVILIGEDGAVLKIKSAFKLPNADGSADILPAIYILNAPRTLIQNIDFQPVDNAENGAILVENANESAIMNCIITKHQYGIIVEKSDRMTIMRNKVTTTTTWQTNEPGLEGGIFIINGKSSYIADNSIANAFFGVWPCDLYGTYERNTTTGNYIGMILCNVPQGSYNLPSGVHAGSNNPSGYWKVRNNVSTDNFNAGYLVISTSAKLV